MTKMKETEVKGVFMTPPQKKVLCAACGEPIKVEDLGGILKDKCYHKFLTCLVDMKLDKEDI